MIKIENKLQEPYSTNYNLLIVQDLWQAHYQIFMIIFLKEFIKLNGNMDMIIKNAKRMESNHLILYENLCCNMNYQKTFDERIKQEIC